MRSEANRRARASIRFKDLAVRIRPFGSCRGERTRCCRRAVAAVRESRRSRKQSNVAFGQQRTVGHLSVGFACSA